MRDSVGPDGRPYCRHLHSDSEGKSFHATCRNLHKFLQAETQKWPTRRLALTVANRAGSSSSRYISMEDVTNET